MVASPGRRNLSDDERLSVRGGMCSFSAPSLADTRVALRELRGGRRVPWVKAPVFELLAGAILVLGLNIAFAVAIVVANVAVPHAVLKDGILHFIATGEVDARNWPVDFTGNKLDRYSDCTGLSLNLIGDANRGPIELLSHADVIGSRDDGRDACEVLVEMQANDEPQLPLVRYFRYWHGYQILTKPLLPFVDLTTLRMASGLLYLLALGGFFVVTATGRHRLLDGAFLAAGFALLTGAENLNGVMVHNLALLATFVGGLAMHRAALGASYSRLFLAGIVVSACIAYIDENYVPPLAAMVLVLAAIAARCKAGCESAKSLGQTFVVVLFGWAYGYLGTMLLRVGVSALLLPDPADGIRDFVAQLMLRMNGGVPWETHGFFASILRNSKLVIYNPILPVVLVGTAMLVATRIAAGWRFAMPDRASFYVLIAALPFLWYMTFRNYAVIHAWFMYRWAAFSVVCCVGGVLACLQSPSIEVRRPAGSTVA
jgi:hypothetical protein